jgi:hypothetical protein
MRVVIGHSVSGRFVSVTSIRRSFNRSQPDTEIGMVGFRIDKEACAASLLPYDIQCRNS